MVYGKKTDNFLGELTCVGGGTSSKKKNFMRSFSKKNRTQFKTALLSAVSDEQIL